MIVKLEEHPEGVVLPVRVHAGARRNELRGEVGGVVRISVTQVAEKGKANKAIIELLSRAIGLKRSQIALVTGETSQQKRFLLRGCTVEEIARRFAEL